MWKSLSSLNEGDVVLWQDVVWELILLVSILVSTSSVNVSPSFGTDGDNSVSVSSIKTEDCWSTEELSLDGVALSPFSSALAERRRFFLRPYDLKENLEN